MNVLQAFVRARKLIARGWCQGMLACDEYGYVPVHDDRATAFCAAGALDRTTESVALLEVCLRALGRAADVVSVTAWNDAGGRTKKQVLAAFDKAIRSARRARKGQK